MTTDKAVRLGWTLWQTGIGWWARKDVTKEPIGPYQSRATLLGVIELEESFTPVKLSSGEPKTT